MQLLNDVLIPDKPMEYDIKLPTGKKLPLAMRDYEYLRKSLLPSALSKYSEQEKQEIIKEKQNLIADAIKRALNNQQTYLFMIYYEEHTKKLVYQQLRQAFLLQDDENFANHITIKDIHIDNSELIREISVTGTPSKNPNFDQEIKKGRRNKRQVWRNFLQTNVLSLIENKNNSNIFAIIDIGQTQRKGIHPQQGIKSVVREACVLENINSQMLQTVKPTAKDDTVYSPKTRGRTLNAVLDLTLRQTGKLYGLPSEVYQIAKISENIAQKLDLIAFCRVQKNSKNFVGRDKFQYAIAVRLSATGIVDV